MSNPINALSNEQRRQSEELSEMRKMHIEQMRSVAELCGRLDVIKAQYDNSARVQVTMQSEIKVVMAKVDGVLLDQAANRFTLDMVRNIYKGVLMAAVSALGACGSAIFIVMKGMGQ